MQSNHTLLNSIRLIQVLSLPLNKLISTKAEWNFYTKHPPYFQLRVKRLIDPFHATCM